MYHKLFHRITSKYCSKEDLIQSSFNKISEEYNSKKRFYHNVEHIESMLKKLSFFTEEIEDIDNLSLAIIYHDVIYNARKGNNEEESAKFAQLQLTKLNFPEKEIQRIENLIISTKLHKPITNTFDALLLLDLDLMILGATNEEYSAYAEKIRQEYKFVPLFLYRKKRKEVLLKFLETEQIFLTNYFFENFEEKARENIQQEMSV